jgi:opacity protein-like surface antigen
MSSLKHAVIATCLAIVALGLAPATARADGLLIPFLGVNFAGDSGEELENALDASRFNWGASFGYMGGGVFGLEGDIGYSPDFFGKTDLGGTGVLTITGNLLLGIPFGGQAGFGIRPYGLIGVGLIRPNLDAFGDLTELEENEFAWDFGGGVMIFFGTNIGVRADLRYFRTFGDLEFGIPDFTSDDEPLDFARASAGLVLRF